MYEKAKQFSGLFYPFEKNKKDASVFILIVGLKQLFFVICPDVHII